MRKNVYLLSVLAITFHAYSMQHQNSEGLREEAKKGHAEAMWSLAMDCYNRKEYKEAQKWRNRYVIRTRQDASCSTDPSVVAARNAVVGWDMANLNSKMEQELAHVFPNDQALKQRFLKDIAWVRKLDSLPEPTWIAKYGMQHPFMGTPLDKIFIAMNECNKKRQEVLDQYVQAFKEDNK